MVLVLKLEAIVLEFLSRAKPKELGESLVGLLMVPVASAMALVPVLPEPVAGPLPVMYSGMVLLSLEEIKSLVPLGLLVLMVISCFWIFTSSSAVLLMVDSKVGVLVEIERECSEIAETLLGDRNKNKAERAARLRTTYARR